MAGANTSRVMKMLVSNAIAANTGNSAATAVAEDVIIVDRNGAEAANGSKQDMIRVMLGLGSGKVEHSAPIQVRNVRKVTTQIFTEAVQHVVAVNGTVSIPSVEVGVNYSIKITHHDLHQVFSHKSEEFYTVKAVTGDTATTILTKIKAKIDANKSARVVATMAGAVLTLTGKAITSGPNASILNQYMFSFFHVALKSGFDAFADGAMTITAGNPGNGLGKQVKDLERLSTQSYYRDYTSFPNDDEVFGSPLRAVAGSKYNMVIIEHGSERSGDLTQTFTSPSTTIVAFLADVDIDGVTEIASAKQNAFVTKLNSLI
jgi:hypothetical protein